jgi:hypothetical protein
MATRKAGTKAKSNVTAVQQKPAPRRGRPPVYLRKDDFVAEISRIVDAVRELTEQNRVIAEKLEKIYEALPDSW